MPNVKKFIGYDTTAETVYGIIERQIDSYRLNDVDGTFTAAPADPYASFTEHTIIKGEYNLSENRTVWDDGLYKCTMYEQAGGSPVPASDMVIAYQYMYIKDDAEVVNEAVINNLALESGGNLATVLADTNEIQGLIASSKIAAQVKGQDDIDFSVTQKTSLNAATPTSVQGAVGSITGITFPTNFAFLSISAAGLVDILQTAADKVWGTTARTLTALGSSLVTEIWNAATSGMATVGSIGKKLADWVVGTIDTYTGNTKQTGDVGVAGAGLTDLGGMSTTMKAQVRDAMKLAPTAGDPAAGSVDKHLDDIYAKPLVTLPAMQARVYSAFLIQNQITKIKQGDTPRINFQIDGDWSTWTARFGVKETVSDTAYKIGPKDCVVGAYDPVTDTTPGYVDLTTTDTAVAGTKWYGEIELKKAGAVHTLINYLLTIEADVIK